MNWSEKRQAIFNFVEHGSGSAVLIAVAGSGKTTTIVECARRLPASAASAFVAFNIVLFLSPSQKEAASV